MVEQVRRGNEAAFEAVYDRHHRGILSFCRHMLASVEEAEDAVQQTFISAYGSLRDDSRDIRLKPWLYTIARNRCLSTLRARQERPAELEDIPTAGLAEEVQHRTDLRELLSDLRELPEDQRAALVLSEIGDLSHAEVGAVVGCEPPKVKSLVFQARSSLIETRNAREIPCQEIREQLATATGGVLRRGPLRRHLKACEGCAEFAEQVKHQRRALALILPVVPTLALKKSALASLFTGGGGAGGAAIGGGGAVSFAGSGIALKAVTVAAITGAAVGGGLLINEHSSSRIADAAGGQQAAAAPVIKGALTAMGPGAASQTRTIANRAASKPHATVLAKAPSGGAKSGGNGGKGGNGSHSTRGLHKDRPHANGGRRSGRGRAPSKGGSDRGGRHSSGGGNHSGGSTGAPAAGNGTPAATVPPASTGNGGSRHGNHGNHGNGNRGHHAHDQHPQDVNGVHVPSGHAPAPAPVPPATHEGDDENGHGNGNGGRHGSKDDDQGDGRHGGDDHGRLIPALPAPPASPAS